MPFIYYTGRRVASRCRICSLIQWYVFSTPSRNGFEGAHPSFSLISTLSEFLPLTPRGPSIFLICRFLPEISITILVKSCMVIILSYSIFTGPEKSVSFNLRTPSTHSSTIRKKSEERRVGNDSKTEQ